MTTGRGSIRPISERNRVVRTLRGLEMKHAVSRELHGSWTRARAARAAPEWALLEPAIPSGILADVFRLEVDDPEAPSFAIRAAGARFDALLGGASHGASLPGLFDAADRGPVLRVLRGVLDHQAPVALGLRAAPPGDHPCVDLEMLLLPLRHRGRTHARVLGSVAPFQAPTWLGHGPVERVTLASVRFLDEEEDAGRAPFARQTAPPRRHGHLDVHQGGRAAR